MSTVAMMTFIRFISAMGLKAWLKRAKQWTENEEADTVSTDSEYMQSV